jgi:hypothetical protein
MATATEKKQDFSHKHLAKERSTVAKEIHQVRQEYFKKQKTFKEQLDSVLEEAKAKKATSSEVRSRLESAEQQLNDRSSNIIKRLFFYRSINKLRSEVKLYKATQESLNQEMANLASASQELANLAHDRVLLGEARQKLDKFYGHVDEIWNNYKDDLVAGNVNNFLCQRGTIIMHAFQNPIFSPSEENGVIRREIRWRDKLDLLIALEPSISSSAVNEKFKDVFAPVGVVIVDGQITEASSRDIATKAVDRNTRKSVHSREPERIRQKIDNALKEHDGAWTEFVVNEPKVGGIFFKVEPDGKMADLQEGSDTTIKEVVAVANERNLPLFALKDGKLYNISAEEALTIGTPVESTHHGVRTISYPNFKEDTKKLCSSVDLANLPHGADPVFRESIIEKFMSNSPFQLHRFPEALLVRDRAEGQVRYLLLTASAEGKTIQEKTINGLKVKMISTVPTPTHLDHIIQQENGEIAIWAENRNPVSARSRAIAGSLYDDYSGLITKEASLQIRGFFVEDKITSPSKLVMILNREINKNIGRLRDPNDYLAKDYTSSVACYAYGVAEEARKAGDEKIANFAESIASKVMSIEQYQDLIKRRVSENGTFKLTRKELLGDSES